MGSVDASIAADTGLLDSGADPADAGTSDGAATVDAGLVDMDAAADAAVDAAVDSGPVMDAATDAYVEMDAAATDSATDDAGPAFDNDAGMCIKSPNYALAFTGSEYVSVPDTSAVHFSSLTIEAWVNFASTTTGFYETIVAKPYGSATADSFAIWYQFGGLWAGVNPYNTATGIGGTWAPTLGTWYHVAFTYDESTFAQSLYIDGALFASGTMTTPEVYDSQPFFVGVDLDYGTLTGGFVGAIDEVRIWTSVRDQEQVLMDRINCVPGSIAGLGVYFGFDENSGQIAHDLSASGNDGTLGSTGDADSNDPTWITSTVPF